MSYKKRNFPLVEIRRFVEPGPIVLVSSSWKDESNIMTMGWHTMMSFEPALIGCYIWPENHSFRDDTAQQGVRDQHSDGRAG